MWWVGLALPLAALASGCGLFGAPPAKPAIHARQIPSHAVAVAGYGFTFQVPRSWSPAAPAGGHTRWQSANQHAQVEAWGTKAPTWVKPASFVAHQNELGIPARAHIAAFAQAQVHGWTRLEESWTQHGEDYLLIAFLNGRAANLALFQYTASDLATGIQVVARAAQTFKPRA